LAHSVHKVGISEDLPVSQAHVPMQGTSVEKVDNTAE